MHEKEAEVGEVVKNLLSAPLKKRVPVCGNLDINYLAERTGLSRQFSRRMLRWFGETVVLESLRRLANGGWQYPPDRKEAVFVGICRVVEKVRSETQTNGEGR